MNVGRDMPRFPLLCECLGCSDLVVFIGLSLAQMWHFGVFFEWSVCEAQRATDQGSSARLSNPSCPPRILGKKIFYYKNIQVGLGLIAIIPDHSRVGSPAHKVGPWLASDN